MLVALVRLTAPGADVTAQLEKDIETLASMVAAGEKAYVTNYLRKGPSGMGADFLVATMARNALNKIQTDRVMPSLARTMHRHAQGTNFPSDTRQYGFSQLTRMAGRNNDVAAMTRSLAEEIVERETDPLKRSAERFLRGDAQHSTQQSAPGFTADKLVGRWRHIDRLRNLASNLTFRKDGTYTGHVEVNGKANGSFSGNWKLEGGTLYFEYTASSDKIIPAGSKDQDKLIELARDHYTIENTLGLREIYIRVE